MEAALLSGDVAAVGAHLDAYWEQKKLMCDAEPPAVARMLAALRPLVFGASLAGAGGGGFMLLVTKEPDAGEAVRHALREEAAAVHGVSMHALGMHVEVLPLDGLATAETTP